METNNHLADLDLLYDAFKASMKGSSWKEEPQKFENNFLSELSALNHEITDGTYHTMPGTEFTLNERGKIRYIHGGRMRDRVVRHALCDGELNGALRPYLIYNNGASQKGKGVKFTRDQFEKDLHNYWLEHRSNEGYIAIIDYSKFYDNIRHSKIRELVYPKISPEAQRLMDEIIKNFEIDVSYMTDEEYALCMDRKFDSVKYAETVPKELRTGEKFMCKSVDIGDQVSQDIGVFFPTPVDNYITIVRGFKYYGRYMDDMYIIHNDKKELHQLIREITEIANGLGMYINDRKTRIVPLSKFFKFLQIYYRLDENGRVDKKINSDAVTRERRRIKAYKRKMDRGEMTYDQVEQACKSWMGNFAKLMSKQQIKNMKSLYQELFGKELVWKPQQSFLKTVRKSKQKSTATP